MDPFPPRARGAICLWFVCFSARKPRANRSPFVPREGSVSAPAAAFKGWEFLGSIAGPLVVQRQTS